MGVARLFGQEAVPQLFPLRELCLKFEPQGRQDARPRGAAAQLRWGHLQRIAFCGGLDVFGKHAVQLCAEVRNLRTRPPLFLQRRQNTGEGRGGYGWSCAPACAT